MAALFGFFFFYFLHSTEVKAASFFESGSSGSSRYASQVYFEDQSPVLKVGSSAHPAQWSPVFGLLPARVYVEFFESIIGTVFDEFRVIAARDFYFNSGLSPPHFFV